MTSSRNSRHYFVTSLAKSLVIFGLVWVSFGCAPTFKIGTSPTTNSLAELTPQVSTSSDVLRVLGHPPGRGVVEHRKGELARDIWLYRYIVIEGTEAKMKWLFIFLEDEIYDGYLWFSSISEFKITEN